jgi:hypothetical protein
MDTFMEAPFSSDAGPSKHIKRLQGVSVGWMQSKLAVAVTVRERTGHRHRRMATVEKHTARRDAGLSGRKSDWTTCLRVAGTLGAVSLALVVQEE